MIAVIADDFTGAAEIGGIGLRRGLATVIETDVGHAEGVDLLIISADSRSISAEASRIEIERITKELMKLKPVFIFKKLDSVLRGNVVEELTAQMEISGKKKAIVVAGNPYFGRIISNGLYFINGIPANQTSFAEDPFFPVRSAIITEMFPGKWENVISLPVHQPIPESGLIFGDVVNDSDLSFWADAIDNSTVPAGGAGFFETLLDRGQPGSFTVVQEPYSFGNRILCVLGSAYPKNPDDTIRFREMGFSLMNMPGALYSRTGVKPGLIRAWSDNVCHEMEKNGKVVISVNPVLRRNLPLSLRIREIIGKTIRNIFEKTRVDDLLIEGGDTTSVILKYLGIYKLYPFRELDRGVIQMKVEKYPELCLTTKPGSYSWPDCLIFYGGETKENIQSSR